MGAQSGAQSGWEEMQWEGMEERKGRRAGWAADASRSRRGSRRRFLPEEAGGEAPDCRGRVIGLPPALMRGSAGAQMFLCCHGAGPGNGQEPEKAFLLCLNTDYRGIALGASWTISVFFF